MGRISLARNREPQNWRFYKCTSVKAQREQVMVFKQLLDRIISVIMGRSSSEEFLQAAAAGQNMRYPLLRIPALFPGHIGLHRQVFD